MLVKNEATVLEKTLTAAASMFGRFVLLDQESHDRSIEIARDILGSRLTLIQKPADFVLDAGFCGARNLLSAEATLPWVLHVDADEMLAETRPVITIERPGHGGVIDYALVQRRNLSLSEGNAASVDAAMLNAAACDSIEHHIRLYNREAGYRWHSFIHEELWGASNRLPDHNPVAPKSDIVLNHISKLKPPRLFDQKEDLYAWMVMKGFSFGPGSEEALSGYTITETRGKLDYFRFRAENYARERGFATIVAAE